MQLNQSINNEVSNISTFLNLAETHLDNTTLSFVSDVLCDQKKQIICKNFFNALSRSSEYNARMHLGFKLNEIFDAMISSDSLERSSASFSSIKSLEDARNLLVYIKDNKNLIISLDSAYYNDADMIAPGIQKKGKRELFYAIAVDLIFLVVTYLETGFQGIQEEVLVKDTIAKLV